MTKPNGLTDRADRRDTYVDRLHLEWHRANIEEGRISDEHGYDSSEYQEAAERCDKALAAFTDCQATSARGLLTKLRVAFDHEDFFEDAIDRTKRHVAPRILVSVFHDIDRLALKEEAQEAPGETAAFPVAVSPAPPSAL